MSIPREVMYSGEERNGHGIGLRIETVDDFKLIINAVAFEKTVGQFDSQTVIGSADIQFSGRTMRTLFPRPWADSRRPYGL